MIDLKDTTYKVGPGSYLKNTFKQNAIFGTFPKAKKTVGEIIKKDENNDDDDKEYPELPSAINIRDKDRNSYFFISKKNKEENLEKKYGIGDKDEFEKVINKKIKIIIINIIIIFLQIMK